MRTVESTVVAPSPMVLFTPSVNFPKMEIL